MLIVLTERFIEEQTAKGKVFKITVRVKLDLKLGECVFLPKMPYDIHSFLKATRCVLILFVAVKL